MRRVWCPGGSGRQVTRPWHIDYARTSDGYAALCPYCHRQAEYPSLAAAVLAGLNHAETCGGPIHA